MALSQDTARTQQFYHTMSLVLSFHFVLTNPQNDSDVLEAVDWDVYFNK